MRGIAIAIVAVIAVSVVVALAIPRQREAAWQQQVEERLKNAAVAQESYLSVNGEYADSTDQLSPNVYEPIDEVAVTVERADKNSYCLEARHSELPGEVWFIDNVTRVGRADTQTKRPPKGPLCLRVGS